MYLKHYFGIGLISLGIYSSVFGSDKLQEQDQDTWQHNVACYNWFGFDGKDEPSQAQLEGPNVLHNKGIAKPYTKSEQSVTFVQEYMPQAKELYNDSKTLQCASDGVSDNLKANGVFVEVGWALPRNTTFVADLNPEEIVYGLFSEKGMEEDWEKEKGRVIKTGAHKPDPKYRPLCINNIRYFKKENLQTVLDFFKTNILKDRRLAFLSLQVNTYESTKKVFDTFRENFSKGTVIYFDSFYNYPNHKLHEFKALTEFAEKNNYSIEVLGFNKNHEQAAVRIY